MSFFRRKPKGTPTGGQFAAHARGESSVSLGGSVIAAGAGDGLGARRSNARRLPGTGNPPAEAVCDNPGCVSCSAHAADVKTFPTPASMLRRGDEVMHNDPRHGMQRLEVTGPPERKVDDLGFTVLHVPCVDVYDGSSITLKAGPDTEMALRMDSIGRASGDDKSAEQTREPAHRTPIDDPHA